MKRKLIIFNEKHDYLHLEKADSLIKNDCKLMELKSFFSNRSDYEYESYEIAHLEEVE